MSPRGGSPFSAEGAVWGPFAAVTLAWAWAPLPSAQAAPER